jgi:hypothetical protein
MKYCETRKAYIKNIDAFIESIRVKGVLIKDYARRPKVGYMSIVETARGICEDAREIERLAKEKADAQ